MKQRMTKKLNLRADNTGATIITVLVTMTFIIVLASILMYTSLINLQMKKMDKEGKISFYNAETAMNEIRAGVQKAASEAIKESYSAVLVSYNTASEEVQTKNFRNNFKDRMFEYQVMIGGFDRNLLTASGPDCYYSPEVLESFVSEDTGVTVGGGGRVTVTYAGDTVAAIVIRDVTVTHVLNGYQTAVTADIKITAPELPYISTSGKQSKAPDFAIIAGGLLEQAGSGTVTLNGSAYAANVNVGGTGNVFNVQSAAEFVIKGPVDISAGQMNFGGNCALWANEITLSSGGSITLNGDAYVADDLNLMSGARAILNGRYFGFGDQQTPENSSAIIINGENTVLEIKEKMRTLLLAGHSYVNFGTGDTGGYVLMGESISVKSNQLAYLVPARCLDPGITNPYEYELIDGAQPDNAYFQGLVNAEKLSAEYGEYGITSAASNVQYIRKTVGSKHFVYFCLKFSDTAEATETGTKTVTAAEHANSYFADFYGANSELMKKYLDIYSNGVLIPASGVSMNLAGNAFWFTGANSALIGSTTVSPATLGEIKASYANLCVTLSRKETAPETSPFEHYINSAEVTTMVPSGTAQAFGTEGVTRVIVASGDYTIDKNAAANPTPDSVNIVIATGNVVVKTDFEGLIIAGGSVELRNTVSVTSSRPLVADALDALVASDDNGDYYMFFNRAYISPLNVEKNSSDGGVWNLNELVTYENWSKNA